MIRPTSFKGIYHSAPVNKPAQNVIGLEPSQKTAPKSADRVQISAHGAFQHLLAENVSSASREIASSASPERLEALKNQIASGSYQVSSAQLADALLQRAFPGLNKED